jgi:hypothetical protein
MCWFVRLEVDVWRMLAVSRIRGFDSDPHVTLDRTHGNWTRTMRVSAFLPIRTVAAGGHDAANDS